MTDTKNLDTCEQGDLRINDEDLAKLSDGLLHLYQPKFRCLQQQLTELTNKQNQLINNIDVENSQIRETENEELKEMFSVVKNYLVRLNNIKKDMCALSERSSKLKKKALQLHCRKQKEALAREHEREANLKMEQELIAKPNKNL